MLKTFAPNGANTAQLVASSTTSNVAIDQYSNAVRVLNAGPSLAYINFGAAGVTSTNQRIPLPVGAAELFTKGNSAFAAAICDSGNTATLYFTSGEGI